MMSRELRQVSAFMQIESGYCGRSRRVDSDLYADVGGLRWLQRARAQQKESSWRRLCVCESLSTEQS